MGANKVVWQNMRDKLKKMGLVDNVQIGEPTSAPAKVTAAIIPENGRIDENTLDKPREVHRVKITTYIAAIQEPTEETEFKLDDVLQAVKADYFGDFDLGGTIAYPFPSEFTWDYGYQDIGTTKFRLLQISFPYRLDDLATFEE